MIHKFHEAKLNKNREVILWGSGTPMREFLYVDDLAKAVRFAVENRLEQTLYNVDFGSDLSIRDLAELVQTIVGHTGSLTWDSTKPDGTPRKLMDNSLLKKAGWKAQIELEEGIRETYAWFHSNQENFKEAKIAI